MLTWKEKVWKLASVRYTESRRLIRLCLYLEANDEKQTTVKDLIVNIKKIVACDDDDDP